MNYDIDHKSTYDMEATDVGIKESINIDRNSNKQTPNDEVDNNDISFGENNNQLSESCSIQSIDPDEERKQIIPKGNKLTLLSLLQASLNKQRTTVDIKRQEMRDTFNMLFTIPPDFKMAKLHREAQKGRYYDPNGNYINCKCFCCGRISPEFSRYVGLCETEDKLIEYGDGFPLLFQFIRFNILIFILLFIIQGIYMVVVGIILYNSESGKDVSLISLFSVVAIMDTNLNINQSLVYAYEALALISNFFLILFISYMWVKQAKYKNNLDENASTDADYAVII